jgi:hypothetical protein
MLFVGVLGNGFHTYSEATLIDKQKDQLGIN